MPVIGSLSFFATFFSALEDARSCRTVVRDSNGWRLARARAHDALTSVLFVADGLSARARGRESLFRLSARSTGVSPRLKMS